MAVRLPLIIEVNHAGDTLGMYRAETQQQWRTGSAGSCVSGITPLLAMVDQGRMGDVIAVIAKKR